MTTPPPEPVAAPNRLATMQRVTAAFHAWRQAHDAIAALEEVSRLPQTRAEPAQVREIDAEIRELREQADRLLVQAQHALMTIKTPRVSQSDPTQY